MGHFSAVMKTATQSSFDFAPAIAIQFAKNLMEYLEEYQERGAEILEAIDCENAERDSPGVCHSHDYCDANVFMASAFTRVTGREIDLQSHEDMVLWSAAWDFAKVNWFRNLVRFSPVIFQVGNDGDGPNFFGYSTGSVWNGWDCVFVDPSGLAEFKAEYSSDFELWNDLPRVSGLIRLDGFSTFLVPTLPRTKGRIEGAVY